MRSLVYITNRYYIYTCGHFKYLMHPGCISSNAESPRGHTQRSSKRDNSQHNNSVKTGNEWAITAPP